jgi:hypothetical protein
VNYGFYVALSHVPPGLGLVLLAGIPTVIVVYLHHLLIRRVDPADLIEHREVAGFLVAIVGVVFAVSLGFTVVTVWEQFNSAQQTADSEASEVGYFAALAEYFPEPARTRLRAAIADYAFEVRDREWPMLAYGREDLKARSLLLNAIGVVGSLAPSVFQQSELDVTRQLSIERRERILQAQSRLQAELYVAVGINALAVIAFVFLFGMTNHALQLVMTGLVVGAIASQFAVVVELDRPYSGNVRVTAAAWTSVIDNDRLGLYRT